MYIKYQESNIKITAPIFARQMNLRVASTAFYLVSSPLMSRSGTNKEHMIAAGAS